jgi:hypothetical protein
VARRLQYKGYIIKSNPEPVATSGQWRLRIAIYIKTNGILKMQTFSGPTVYDSQDEADVHGIAYGQRIIDEKVPGLKAVSP